MLRTLITVRPELNIELQPQLLADYLHLHIKLNDVVVLLIWLLISLACARSILSHYSIFGVSSFRQLFYDTFLRNEDMLMGYMKIAIVLILTAMSASYVFRMVYFIYTQWSTELSPLLQPLQFYPALLMACQTIYQGSYLLKSLVYQEGDDDCKHQQERKQQLVDHIWLNLTFVVHCCCICVVVHFCVFESEIMFEMVTGEVVFRVFSAYIFWVLLKKVERAPINVTHYGEGEVVQPCQVKESGGDGAGLVRIVVSEHKVMLYKPEHQSPPENLIQPEQATKDKTVQNKSEMVIGKTTI